MLKRPYFSTIKSYGETFTSVDYWRPYIEHVWSIEKLGAIQSCVAGLPGTNPVFIVNDKLVVKFFTDLFGYDTDRVELAFYKDIEPKLDVPTPSLITYGELFDPGNDGWHYPYIVTTLVKGISFGELEFPMPDTQIEAARFAARVLRAFHDVSLPVDGILAAKWTEFQKVLSDRRNDIRASIDKLDDDSS